MFPWLWIWAPQWRLPLSGDVAQDIEPVFNAFFKGIKPEAGNGRIEAKAMDVASYGRQLGLLTDLLVDLAERTLPASGRDDATLQEIKRIRAEIEAIKQTEYAAQDEALVAQVRAVRARGGQRAARLSKRLAAPAAGGR
ncbi:MAG: hypothetical protein KF871_01290 [Hydrogenophaga sp.]|uniref:hypothetical protein n=1 Tax=Hydrogenophaga sp. TaxID=1904254 RepID=UPI001DD77B2C|nr:hypothetical protein [Hydrogenophaga sp.]MBX3608503.1 hypothetical protein [Hydrogenophaga sp.]